MLGWEQGVDGFVVLQDTAGHCDLVHLRRPVGQAERQCTRPHVVQRQFDSDTERAVHLDRPMNDVVIDLRHRHLAHRDVRAGGTVRLRIDDPRGLQNEQPELLEFDRGVRNELLHELLLGEQFALGGA